MVRWTQLRKLAGQVFSEVGKRNFGRPSCIAVSTSIVLGTSKGVILVFDYQQNLKVIIGPGTKAVASGAITSLAISADHTTLAGGHADGTIFTWEILRPARPFLHISPIEKNALDTRQSDGHIEGAAVIHIGFLGTRHTALVSADDHGMAFSHLATRGMGAVARFVRTTRILGRYPETSPAAQPRKPSSVLAFSPLPLGNVEQATDSLGLVAMLTPYLLVIVSTTPVARTQYKTGRPKELAAHSALTATLAWFPAIKLKAKNSEASKTKLAYCWSNVLTILDVDEIPPEDGSDRPPGLQFKPRCRWRAGEAIAAVQWISRSVLAVMTITQQLLILEDPSLRVTDSSDLIRKHIYHTDLFSRQLHTLVEQFDENEQDQSMHGVIADAFYMSFRVYKGRLFVLGFNDISVGSLSNWADRLLALVETGDFIGAIRLATFFYTGQSERLTVGLPEEDELRHGIVQEKLLEMMTASLKFAFGKNEEAETERVQNIQLKDLAEVCIAACMAMQNQEFLFDDVYSWYEEYESEGIFLDVLEPYIVEGSVRMLPPPAVKSLITHFMTNHTTSRLEEIICLLETETMDIDQVTTLCKRHNLYDAFIYVWNQTLHDYIGPLKELVDLVAKNMEGGEESLDLEVRDHTNAMKMFPYLSYILTSRIYPTGNELEEPKASMAKGEIYRFLLSDKDGTASSSEQPFNSLRLMLQFDTPSFMSMLNEAFEDSFLNDPEEQVGSGEAKQVSGSARGLTISRQYLIRILLEIMDPASSTFKPADSIYLDMFIARNLPKYPQYILLSGSTLQQVLVRLCRYPHEEMLEDCQLSAEYLLSSYHPPDTQALIPTLKEAKFFRILKSIYRAEKQYSALLETYLEDPDDQQEIFGCIRNYLRPGSSLNKKQRRDFLATLTENADRIVKIDTPEAARTIHAVAPDLHGRFLETLDSDTSGQYQYLDAVFDSARGARIGLIPTITGGQELTERYVQLKCHYDPSHVADFVDMMKVGDLRLEAVLPSIESSGIVDAAVILLARQGEVTDAMDRLTSHLGTLEAGLSGLLQNVDDSPDSASTTEAVSDLIRSIGKYTRVGIWLCREQSKASKKVYQAGRLDRKSASVLNQPLTYDENLWLLLIEAVVKIAQRVSPLLKGGRFPELHDSADMLDDTQPGYISSPFKALVQQVFTVLLTTTTSTTKTTPHEKTDISFLKILRTFLTRAAAASPSLSELRTVIGSIFSAYTYEESLLSLANTMLDKDLFVHVDEATKLRQRGWRPRGQVCEICRRRMWGPNSGAYIWESWEKKQAEDRKRTYVKWLENSRANGLRHGKGKEKASEPEPEADLHISARTTEDRPVTSGDSKASPDVDVGTASSSSAVPTTPSVTGPAVVFGCRHIYHQSCLVGEMATRGGSYAAHPSGRELACLLCA